MELVCPAGSLPALKNAIDEGADAVYIGLKDDTNARHFAGLNFNKKRAYEAVKYAHNNGKKIFLAINTYPQPAGRKRWLNAIDLAAEMKMDAVIAADVGVLAYAHEQYPELNLHLSVQASATNVSALEFYHKQFNIRRAVLPRVLSLAQVRQLAIKSPIDIEVFGFGSLCIMAEGRCFLSSYITNESPNLCGACSPAKAIQWEEHNETRVSRLAGVLIDRYAKNEPAAYPTLCKGRFQVAENTFHALEEPTSLNMLELLPKLLDINIKAIKIEGRQRSPIYVKQVTHIWRQALNAVQQDKKYYTVQKQWTDTLDTVSEGQQTTLGAYHRPWQ